MHHHHCAFKKNDNDHDLVYLKKLRASLEVMLAKHHWPCHDDFGKEYTCLVSPENMFRHLQFVRRLICERDWIAHQASRLAARMEGIGLGHMDDNPCDWLRAAREHCLRLHPKQEPPAKPKPLPVPDCPEANDMQLHGEKW